MNNYDLNFLMEFGLTDMQIRIYNYLLNNKFCSIEQIKTELNYSYSQVRENLKHLEKYKLITASEGKPKIYFRTNPKIAITELLKKKNNNILEFINKLDENVKVYESSKGICSRNITFYHHSDINTGIEHIYNLIENSSHEIILSSIPPLLLKKFENALKKAYLKGVKLKLYYSNLDFESINNYFVHITHILKDIKIKIVETNEKICRFIKFNDLIVNEGIILTDDYFNSFLFLDDTVFHFNGFFMPNMAENVRSMLNAKTILKSIEINPDPIQNVLDIISNNESIKTRDLSIKSKIGGAKLKEIINFLINEGLIIEENIKTEKAGRPKRVYSLIE